MKTSSLARYFIMEDLEVINQAAWCRHREVEVAIQEIEQYGLTGMDGCQDDAYFNHRWRYWR